MFGQISITKSTELTATFNSESKRAFLHCEVNSKYWDQTTA